MKTRTELVQGENIHIIDDTFSEEEIQAFFEYVEELPFRRKEKSNEYDNFPIFSTDFDPVVFEESTYIGQKARLLLETYVPEGKHYNLFRAYVNLSTYGDVEYPHYDCQADQKDITVLYYVNLKWNNTFGGETIFYEEHDTRLAILPKPGRFVIFPGKIEHMGSVASRICKTPRYSLALKYNLIQ
ncbi:2OG-Fe(II) oxygenase [Chitinophaga sp. HK235]|uniref:2OG-Fe(II) oxygenase n=1 Tax=Chitinophaga sp. HK235 TaxID=2952571 RepID=UPI001BA90A03|nr:2OG-Fe(II) oxygenase [Chitinophaga sp. HK235]